MLLLLAGLALARPVASSVAEDEGGKHTADLALDGLLSTGWAEGTMGYGDGAWWEFELAGPTKLDSISIWPGNLVEGAKSYKEYPRPKLIKVLVDGVQQGEPIRLLDEMQRKDIPLDVTGKKVRIEVVEAFEGGVYADMYLAEVAVNFTEGERARAVEKVDAWRTSKEGEKLQAKHEEDVLAAWKKHKEDDDENEGLDFLMAAAGEGAPFLRKKVASLVPEGYRAAALVPDQKALDAIRKLKDPNGIPGLEMAALRALGKEQRQIREVVEIFYAYQDLVGGGRRSVKPWGDKGWEAGALQSFGEPLAIEIDQFGQLWVADTGNNRIQRFTSDKGVADKQIGKAADVANLWFDGERKWYAAGAAASTESGAFVNPVDVEVIPGKEVDTIVTFDASNRVQIFDGEGNPKIGWEVRIDKKMQAEVGGEGYLAWNPKKKQLVTFVGDDAVVFTLDSEEVARWEAKDGVPKGVEVGPDGKLYMVYADEIVAYNTDGFRYGKVADKAIFGEGFEDLDITFDEEGKLWALTDTGWVFKFKKPGKLDWKIKIADFELQRPRFAASQGMIFVTDRDRILKADALQAHADELARKQDEEAKKKADAAEAAKQ